MIEELCSFGLFGFRWGNLSWLRVADGSLPLKPWMPRWSNSLVRHRAVGAYRSAMAQTSARPRLSLLLSPVVTGSLLLLVVNDHLLKQQFSGFVTGKLSDLAGVVLMACVAAALVGFTLGYQERGDLPVALPAVALGLFVVSVAWTVIESRSGRTVKRA
jgi:hypothetical protein